MTSSYFLSSCIIYCVQQWPVQCDADDTLACAIQAAQFHWHLGFNATVPLFQFIMIDPAAAVLWVEHTAYAPIPEIFTIMGRQWKVQTPSRSECYHIGIYSIIKETCMLKFNLWSRLLRVQKNRLCRLEVWRLVSLSVNHWAFPCEAGSILRRLIQCFQNSSHSDCAGLLRQRLLTWTWVWLSP